MLLTDIQTEPPNKSYICMIIDESVKNTKSHYSLSFYGSNQAVRHIFLALSPPKINLLNILREFNFLPIPGCNSSRRARIARAQLFFISVCIEIFWLWYLCWSMNENEIFLMSIKMHVILETGNINRYLLWNEDRNWKVFPKAIDIPRKLKRKPFFFLSTYCGLRDYKFEAVAGHLRCSK